jgi:hypothetical protein
MSSQTVTRFILIEKRVQSFLILRSLDLEQQIYPEWGDYSLLTDVLDSMKLKIKFLTRIPADYREC